MTVFHPQALANQHIVISGGLGALGTAVVEGLITYGARVTVNDIIPQQEGMDRLNALKIPPESCRYVSGDITSEAIVQQVIAVGRGAFGPVTTALCHTGMVQARPLIEVSYSDWERTMRVNVASAFLLAKYASLSMIEDGTQGHLVFTISWVADTPWPDIGPYNTSKAAMKQLMRSFARELADKRIRANAIAPGIVGAGMAKRQWDTEPDYRARAQRAIPLGYMQPLESVVDGFIFLCSDAAKYMTGSVLLMDGGCSLYPMDE